jgi:hypothetical protein
MGTESARTGPAIAARRQRTARMLTRVEDAITRLRLDGTPLTVRALAGHTRVSATFLYGNPTARALLRSARETAARCDTARSAATTARAEASWRERVLNAEDALSHAHTEILTQRCRIGEVGAGSQATSRQPAFDPLLPGRGHHGGRAGRSATGMPIDPQGADA